MLLVLSFIFVAAGALCLSAYRPEWVRIDSDTKERLDPMTEGEKTGGWLLFIGILLFVFYLF